MAGDFPSSLDFSAAKDLRTTSRCHIRCHFPSSNSSPKARSSERNEYLQKNFARIFFAPSRPISRAYRRKVGCSQ
jgi:hypothetical protein